MRYDLTKKILTPKGEPFSDGSSDLTAQTALYGALSNIIDREMSAEDKVKCWKFGVSLSSSGIISLTPEDIVFLQKSCVKIMSPFLYGAMVEYFSSPEAEVACGSN